MNRKRLRAKELLVESKIRAVLKQDLEAHNQTCLERVKKVKKLCGDDVTYDGTLLFLQIMFTNSSLSQGELYTDKMTYDYSRIIFKVNSHYNIDV